MARNKHPEQTVELILEVSEKLFAERGYEKTTIQDIIGALNMSKGAIYHHFASKDEIMAAIFRKKVEQEQELLRNLISNTKADNTLEKIEKVLAAHYAGALGIYGDSLTTAIELQVKNPQVVEWSIRVSIHENAPQFAKLLEEGIADGSITTDKPLECAEVFSLLFGLWVKPTMFGWDEEQMRSRLELMAAMLRSAGADILSRGMIAMTLELYRKIGCFKTE